MPRPSLTERLAREHAERTKHKNDLAKKFDLVGHPKLDQLYDLAWEFGHSSGYSEVATYFADISVLLK